MLAYHENENVFSTAMGLANLTRAKPKFFAKTEKNWERDKNFCVLTPIDKREGLLNLEFNMAVEPLVLQVYTVCRIPEHRLIGRTI